MEDVLRKIYLQKHQELEKKKLDRKLNLDQPQKRQRIYKNIFQDYLPLVQSFDLETELQMKKKIQFGNDFLQQKHRYKVKSVTSPFQTKSSSLPPIGSHRGQISATDLMTQQQLMLQLKNPQRFRARQKEIQSKLRRKYAKKRFRIQLSRIRFIIRLSLMRKKTLIGNRQKTKSMAANLLQIIDKMVNKYYAKVLEEQILKYLELIKIKIQQPKIMLEKEIVNMLYFMSKQLAESAIIKELLDFIMAISRNGSFFPSDYLTEVEAVRLEFDTKYGSLRNVKQKQKKLIIAVCIGLKIFCTYILYRPWLIRLERSPISPQQIVKNYVSLIKLIHGTASVFYYIIMEEYCDNLEPVSDFNPKIFKKMNLQFQQFLNIFPNDYEVEIIHNPKQIFPNQKKKLYLALAKENPETFAQIRSNIISWIDKIYNTLVKEQQRHEKNRREQIQEQQRLVIQELIGKGRQQQKNENNKKGDPESKQERGFEVTKKVFDSQKQISES